MKYNLTPQQRKLAEWLVTSARAGVLNETFHIVRAFGSSPASGFRNGPLGNEKMINPPFAVSPGMISSLEKEGLVTVMTLNEGEQCTLLGRIYEAVDSGFIDEQAARPISELAQPHPPEMSMSLDRLRSKYPDPKKLGFLIMRFAAAKPFSKIVEVVKETGKKHGLAILRADEQEFHADLWGNVRTYLHGCGFAVAVYERIETDEPNANVGLEVGYLLAMNKPVLLLKDQTLPNIQSDLAGKLYKPFDPHDPEGTIPPLLEKWLEDYGIIVPGVTDKGPVPVWL